jgi:hypothetical protein
MVIFGQEKMAVDYSCFVGSELGQDVGGGLFGFIVGSICVIIVPNCPLAKEVDKMFLKTKSRRFRDVDANKFHSAAFRSVIVVEMIARLEG